MKNTILVMFLMSGVLGVEAMHRVCMEYTEPQRLQATTLLQERDIDFDVVYRLLRNLGSGIRKDSDFLSALDKLRQWKEKVEQFLVDRQRDSNSDHAVNAELLDNILSCRTEINRTLSMPILQKRLIKLTAQ